MDSKQVLFDELIVVKRSGQRTEFKGEKIAIAIKKAFDSIENIYTDDDVNKVYSTVLKKISKDYQDRKTIKIEDIQDIIEEQLKTLKYLDVYESFSNYRERRAASRETFALKQQHKFLKAIETLGLGSVNENSDAEANLPTSINPQELMLNFGSVVSKEFAKAYLLENKYVRSADEGQIYIDDIDFLGIGTTNNLFIDLDKLFQNGFKAGYGFLRKPNDIYSYITLATVAIKSNQKDQHGEQSIPHFDYYMAPGVLKTFKKYFKWILRDYLELEEYINLIDIKGIDEKIKEITSIAFDLNVFQDYFYKTPRIEHLFRHAYAKAVERTDEKTYQAMEAFIHNLNTTYTNASARNSYVSINLGTDITFEGQMVIKNYLKALEAGLGHGEMPLYTRTIFKVKKGINGSEKDTNYEYFEKTLELIKKNYPVSLVFLDSTFNKKYLVKGNYQTEVAYMNSEYRIYENIIDPDYQCSAGRGNLAVTSINLPRLGIKYGLKYHDETDMKGFYQELESVLLLVRNQLLQRFEIECSKTKENFKFLMGESLYYGSETSDKLKKALKHGTLAINFVGLSECLKALVGKNHLESDEAYKLGQEIVKFMNEKINNYAQEYKLNFVLTGIADNNAASNFVALDRSIYGKIKGVTDKSTYTHSFHLEENDKINPQIKIERESVFHRLISGGHVLLLDSQVKKLNELINIMIENNIGYVKFN